MKVIRTLTNGLLYLKIKYKRKFDFIISDAEAIFLFPVKPINGSPCILWAINPNNSTQQKQVKRISKKCKFFLDKLKS